MELPQLNPFVRYARNQSNLRVKPNTSICRDCRLFFLRQGSGMIEIGLDSCSIAQSTVIYLPPRSMYRFLPSQDQHFSILVFNFDLVDDYSHLRASLGTADADRFDPASSPDYPIPDDLSQPIVQSLPQACDALEGCTDGFLKKAPYHRETASAVIKTTLLELLKNRSVDGDLRIAGQVTDYIHNHFSDPELTNARIAEQFGYHPYYLSQLMKRATGKTLHSYLLYYRIRIAKNFLATTDWDIETVAWQSGFNSVSYFIKLFREHTGVTPLNYRRSQANYIL